MDKGAIVAQGTAEQLKSDGLLRARVDAGASALPAVLQALDTAQLRVATASVVRPVWTTFI